MRTQPAMTRLTMPGLYVRSPHAIDIAYGRKTVETRGYPMPAKHIGQWVAIIETGSQKSGVVGLGLLSGWELYETEEQWAADVSCHRIPAGDKDYGWGTTKHKYGWHIAVALPAWHYAEAFSMRKGGRVWTSVSADHSLIHSLILNREEMHASTSRV